MNNCMRFQIIRVPKLFFSTTKFTQTTERIDAILLNFEVSIRKMKKYLQDSGVSRRNFINPIEQVDQKFAAESRNFKEIILKRSRELNETEFSRSIVNLGSIYRLKEAETVFNAAKLNFPSCPDIYSAIIYAYGKMGCYEAALKNFEEFTGRFGDRLISRKMLEGLLEAYSVHIEKQILEAKSRDDQRLESSNSIHRKAHSEKVLHELSMDPALKIYHQMLKLKFTPSIATLTRLIRLSGRLRQFGALEDLMKEVERFNLKFDAQAYEVLIFAQMQCSRWEEAEETVKRALNQPEENSISKSDQLRLLNVMLFGYCNLKRPLEAYRILKQFREEQGIEPDASSLSYLAGTAAKSGLIRDAEKFYQQLKTRHSDSSFILVTANHLLSAYLKFDDYDKFFGLIDDLGSSRDAYTNSMLFEALSRSKDQKRLSKELEITRDHMNRTNLSCIELAALFRCLFSFFDGDDRLIQEFVLHVQKEIQERPEEKRKELQLILLDVFSKLKEWNRCVDLVQTILLTSPCIDPIIFVKLMGAAGSDSQQIEFVLGWMDRVKCWRDPAILTAAMKQYWEAECSSEARSLWSEIKSKRNKARTFSVAIGVMAEILLKEEGPTAALSHLHLYKHIWNDLCIEIYLKAMRLNGSASSNEIESFFFEKIVRMNPLPSVEVCNEVLICCLNKKEAVDRISDWMCQAARYPNIQTINILLADKFRSNLIPFANRMVDEMIRVGCKVSPEMLLRMISEFLSNPQTSSRAETYTNNLLLTSGNDSNIKLEVYQLWLNYFIKTGQSDKISALKFEIDKVIK